MDCILLQGLRVELGAYVTDVSVSTTYSHRLRHFRCAPLRQFRAAGLHLQRLAAPPMPP